MRSPIERSIHSLGIRSREKGVAREGEAGNRALVSFDPSRLGPSLAAVRRAHENGSPIGFADRVQVASIGEERRKEIWPGEPLPGYPEIRRTVGGIRAEPDQEPTHGLD